MFPTNVVSGIGQGDTAYKLLKPWWDVLTDYLAVAMLMISFVAGTMQITKGGVICVPVVDCQSGNNYTNTTAKNICSTYEANYTGMKPIRTLTLADRRQYDFVDAECGVKAVHWFQSYFPFIIFLEVLLLTVTNKVWLKLPRTASVLERFISLVLECHSTQGTLLDLPKAIGRPLRPTIRQDNIHVERVDSQSETTGRSVPNTRQDRSNVPENSFELQPLMESDETSLLSDSSKLSGDNQTTSSEYASAQEITGAQNTDSLMSEDDIYPDIRRDEDQSETEMFTNDHNSSLQVNQKHYMLKLYMKNEALSC